MTIVKTHIFNALEATLKDDHPLLRVLIGPRQVGKTTTARAIFAKKKHKNHLYQSADGVNTNQHSWLKGLWQQARQQKVDWLIIDEIQKIENWSESVKKLHDEDRANGRNLRCLLMGSSSLQIQKGLSESLTGRFVLIQAYHWNYQESHQLKSLNFEHFMKYGGYPGSYQFLDKDSQLFTDYIQKSILATVIERDILTNHKVKSPALFKQAFEIVTSYPAQIISYTKLLGQLQDKGNTDLVKYYLSLYEGAFLIKQIFKFSERPVLKKTSSPKIIPLCPVFYYISIQDDYREDERGQVFEAIVGAALLRTNFDVYYWRDGRYEVDFILKKGRKIYAIEVKSGRRKKSKGLEVFCERHPDAQAVFITPENYQQLEKQGSEFFASA